LVDKLSPTLKRALPRNIKINVLPQ